MNHWLYGEIHFNEEITEETKCTCCAHLSVCNQLMNERCVNYSMCTSDEYASSCASCIHHFTKYNKQPVLCFKCNDFLEVK